MQNYQSGLYAEYSYDFENDKGKVYDLESISQVPISFIASPNDKFCPPETVLAMSKRLSTLENYVTVEGEESNHYLFAYSNNKNLVRALKRELESADGDRKEPSLSTVYLDKEYIEPVKQDDNMNDLWDMLFDSSVSMAAPAATLTALFAAAMLH